MTIPGTYTDPVLTLQKCSNGTWAVAVTTGEGQTRAALSNSYFDTEEKARTGARFIGLAYGVIDPAVTTFTSHHIISEEVIRQDAIRHLKRCLVALYLEVEPSIANDISAAAEAVIRFVPIVHGGQVTVQDAEANGERQEGARLYAPVATTETPEILMNRALAMMDTAGVPTDPHIGGPPLLTRLTWLLRRAGIPTPDPTVRQEKEADDGPV